MSDSGKGYECSDFGLSKMLGMFDKDITEHIHHACMAHDQDYVDMRGYRDRLVADRRFRDTLIFKGHPVVARFYYVAVRVGGSMFVRTPWLKARGLFTRFFKKK